MNTVEYADFVKSNAPYPEIRVKEKNKPYADLLKEAYVGLFGESTSVSQYLYHHYDSSDKEKEISQMLKEVAIVEAEHFDILARTIHLLGEKPIYYSQDGFWKASFVSYGVDLLEQLESDLILEYRAISYYNQIIEVIDDPYVKEILKRIVLDEEAHVQFFKMAIENVKKLRGIN